MRLLCELLGGFIRRIDTGTASEHDGYHFDEVLDMHNTGRSVRTIGQARATVAMTMMAACYNMKRLASFLERGVDAFFKPATTKAQVRLQTAKA